MKFHQEDSRTIRFSEIQDVVSEMDVSISFPGGGDIRKRIVIDRTVVPHIMKGLRLAEIFKDMDILEVEEMMIQMKKFTPQDTIYDFNQPGNSCSSGKGS